MFTFSQIGVIELLLLSTMLLLTGAISFFYPNVRRWWPVVACILVAAMVFTPADAFSMCLFATFACVIFASGVVLSSYLRGPREPSAS